LTSKQKRLSPESLHAHTTVIRQESRRREDLVGEESEASAEAPTFASDPVRTRIELDGAYELETYPNPVRSRATVELAVRESQDVRVGVYDALGRRVPFAGADCAEAPSGGRTSGGAAYGRAVSYVGIAAAASPDTGCAPGRIPGWTGPWSPRRFEGARVVPGTGQHGHADAPVAPSSGGRFV